MIDMQKFSAWIATVQGQYINMDGAYGAQCWDLHAHFADWFGLPRVDTGYAGRWMGWAGNMYDAYPQTPAIEAAYERVSGSQPAQAGDTAIWDDSFWYYPKTHVAQVVQDGAQLLCISQNSTPSQPGNPYLGSSTGPATLQHLPKGGLLGYLRPRTGTINPQGTTTQEETVALEESDRQKFKDFMDDYFMNVRRFDGRNIFDNAERTRQEIAGVAAGVKALPQSVLIDYRVDGRNLFDSIKQVRTDVFGTRGATVDVQALAKELADALPQTDAEALVDALAARLAGGK